MEVGGWGVGERTDKLAKQRASKHGEHVAENKVRNTCSGVGAEGWYCMYKSTPCTRRGYQFKVNLQFKKKKKRTDPKLRAALRNCCVRERCF